MLEPNLTLHIWILQCVVIFISLLIIWVIFLSLRSRFHLREIPMPPGHFIFGHLFDILDKENQLIKFTKYAVKYDGIFKIYVPPTKASVILTDPELIKILTTTQLDKPKDYLFLKNWFGHGLLTVPVKHWKRQRNMLTPHFNRFSQMAHFVKIFENYGDELVAHLEGTSDGNIEMLPLMKWFAINSFCEIAFSQSKVFHEAYNHKYFESVEMLQKICVDRSTSMKRFDFWYKFTETFRQEWKALDTVNKLFEEIVEKKLEEQNENNANVEEYENFLDMLLKLRKENGLTIEHIRHEINTFLFAGHDTTSNGLAFTLYALSKNPKIQDKIFEEQSNILGDKVKVTYSDLQQMKYLESVVNESLRMYPPIPLIGRKVTKSMNLAGKYHLEKNQNVGIFIYGCHHNPKYFPEPEKFIPERFLNGNAANSLMTFSYGPRTCIARKFAMLEMKSCILKMVRKFHILPPKPDENIHLYGSVVLRTLNPVRISLKKRI
ncbi:unnamed protein product [Phyllotreta striolata]|uniref:Cytochrome P450 n=1 Tax=Phyllotreta striolata TaxID=444603 RepID=A0A9N9TSY7_PHYSR|nr:unnamed protein product [Phyllotreta striolata]